VPVKGVENFCIPCPNDKAECSKGGFEIGPKMGYWRKSKLSEVFLPCKNKDACLGLYKNKTD
jgi:hypothetical protein